MADGRSPRIAAEAAGVLRAAARALWRAAAYVGPLLLAGMAYLWRTTVDFATGVQGPFRSWRDRRHPEGAARFEAWQTAARERRSRRWSSWATVPARRRLEIRAAALALVLAAVFAVRAQWPAGNPRSGPPDAAGTGSAADRDAVTSATASDPAQSTAVDGSATAGHPEQFLRAVQTAASNQWLLFPGPVLAPGRRGAWDDFRVGSPIVMHDSPGDWSRTATGARHRMWFVGCRLAGAEYGCGVGHATSPDGVAWVKADTAVFVPPDVPPRRWLSAIAVVKASNEYFLWYSVESDFFGDEAEHERATLRLATSRDGLAWQHVGIVHTANEDATRYINHAVHHDGRLFHLWYVETAAGDEGAGLQHLTSPDGRAWSVVGTHPLQTAGAMNGAWVGTDPSGGFRALLVNGNTQTNLQWFASPDGTQWTPRPPERGPSNVAGDRGVVTDEAVVEDARGLWLWITTAPATGVASEEIGLAFRKASRP